MPVMSNQKKWFIIRLFIYIISFTVLIWIPWRYIAGAPVICPFRRFLGINCLGCGMTRAFSQLAHMHLNQAFAYNALSFLFFPGYIILAIWDVIHEIRALPR